MSMADLSFLLYFLPATLLGYFLLSFSGRAQNVWLALCSFAFYALGSIAYAVLLLVMTLANYYLGYSLHRQLNKQRGARGTLCFAITLNLLPLFFFRYLHPLISTLLGFFYRRASPFPAAPLSIAFLALQGISFCIRTACPPLPALRITTGAFRSWNWIRVQTPCCTPWAAMGSTIWTPAR